MKKYYSLFIFLLLPLLTAGCAALLSNSNSTATPQIELAPNQWIKLPKPSQLKFNITATQLLTAEYKIQNNIHTYTSQVQIEKTPEYLTLVAIAGWGGEIFSINYNGTNIKTTSLPMPNAEIGIEHVLTDFVLTYADDALLKNLLKTTDIKLITKPKQRLFMLHNKIIIEIKYQNKNPWQGNIILKNFQYNYTIKITSVTDKEKITY